MRPYAIFVLALLGGSSLTGCAFFQDLQQKKATELDSYHDEYKVAGDEGRADLPREKESDGLTPWMQSSKARAIEKNLGID
ncbi:MAG: hypothetical protein JWM11_1361 [Planctomycetaceae bacterium]|nr:hypothetical protein [Planctomycetaceae bacterium]